MKTSKYEALSEKVQGLDEDRASIWGTKTTYSPCGTTDRWVRTTDQHAALYFPTQMQEIYIRCSTIYRSPTSNDKSYTRQVSLVRFVPDEKGSVNTRRGKTLSIPKDYVIKKQPVWSRFSGGVMRDLTYRSPGHQRGTSCASEPALPCPSSDRQEAPEEALL